MRENLGEYRVPEFSRRLKWLAQGSFLPTFFYEEKSCRDHFSVQNTFKP